MAKSKSPYSGGRSGGGNPYGRGSGGGPTSGINQIIDPLEQLVAAAEDAVDRQRDMARALQDTDYQDASRKLRQLTAANQEFVRTQERAEQLGRRRQAVDSGKYASELKAAKEYQTEVRKIEMMERRADLQARYGRRLGGAAAAAERAAATGAGRFAHGAATAAVATGTGLAMSGFQNTAELNRFNAQLGLVSREMGNVFQPALNAASSGMGRLARAMQGMSGRQQDAVMYGGLAAAGGLAANSAAKRFGYAGLAEAGAAGLAGARGLGAGGLARGGGALAVGAVVVGSQFEEGGKNLFRDVKWSDQQLADYGQKKLGETSRFGRVAASLTEDTFGKAGDFLGLWGKDRVSFKSVPDQAAEELERRNKVKAANDHRNLNLAGGPIEAIGSGYMRAVTEYGKLEDSGTRPEVKYLEQIAKNTEKTATAPPPR